MAEAELDEHRVEGPDVGRGASDRGGLERAGEGGGVPCGARARQRCARARHVGGLEREEDLLARKSSGRRTVGWYARLMWPAGRLAGKAAVHGGPAWPLP